MFLHLGFLFFFFLKSCHNLHVLTKPQLTYRYRIIPSIFELSCFSGLVSGVFVFVLGCFLGIINISVKLDLWDAYALLLERSHVYDFGTPPCLYMRLQASLSQPRSLGFQGVEFGSVEPIRAHLALGPGIFICPTSKSWWHDRQPSFGLFWESLILLKEIWDGRHGSCKGSTVLWEEFVHVVLLGQHASVKCLFQWLDMRNNLLMSHLHVPGGFSLTVSHFLCKTLLGFLMEWLVTILQESAVRISCSNIDGYKDRPTLLFLNRQTQSSLHELRYVW